MADNNELVESTNVLKAALDELAKSTTGLSSDTLKKLDNSHKKLTQSAKDSADAIEDEIKERERLSRAFRSMVKDLAQAATAVRANRDDFNSLAPAVDAAATAAGFAAGALGRLATSVGQVISALGGKTLAGLFTKAFGSAVSSVGKFADKYGEGAAQVMATMFKFSLAEVQRISTAFQSLSNVGGLAGTSIQGMFEASQKLGLSMDSYAKLIGRNSQGLAFAAGSVAAGAKAVERITTVGTEFEEQFLKLGFSLEQQSDFAAKFLALNRISSRISLNDTKALSEASRKYLLQIDELARVTGKSRDSIAAKLEQEQRELRYGAALDLMTPENREAARKINDMLASISPELSQMYKSSLGSLGTEMSQNFYLMTQGVSEQVRQQLLGKDEVNVQEIVKSLIAGAKGFGDTIGSTQYEAVIGGMGSKLDPILVPLRLFKDTTVDLLKNAMKAKKDQDKDRKDESANTKNVVKAQIALRDLAKQMDEMVMKQLFPIMSQQVKFFTEALSDGIKLINKWLGKDTTRYDFKAVADKAEEMQQEREAQNLPRDPPWMAAAKATMALAKKPITQPQPPIPTRAVGDNEFERAQRLANNKDPLEDLNIKNVAESTGGAEATPQLYEAARAVQKMYPGAWFTAFDDKYHRKHHPNSAHTKGKAFDMVTLPPPRSADEALDIKKSLLDTSLFTKVRDEYFTEKTGNTKGDHFHAEVAAKGAIISGPSSGYRTAIETHGNEIIMPLKKDSPQLMVETKGMEEQLNLMSLQLRRLDNITLLLQNSADTQTKIYQATVG